MRRFLAFSSSFLIFVLPISAQNNIEINQQNKTIAVTADDAAEVAPDLARVAIGYHNYGRTQDAAYNENVRIAEQIAKAFSAAGVPKENIQTESIQLSPAMQNEKWSPEERQERQFEASQNWLVRVPAAAAEAVINAAVKAGANVVGDVNWDVTDRAALEAKAISKALEKSRRVAQEMAASLGIRLGALLHASNRGPTQEFAAVEVQAARDYASPPPPPPELKLFPRKVKQSATVYAVFAIQ